MIAFAYVPQIYKMKKNQSSEDVSMSFLIMIWISMILMGWYSFTKYFQNEYHLTENDFFALCVTNIANFFMVSITIYYAFKLRR